MEPRTSTRSGQIATNTPLKNALGQRWAIHKNQFSRKRRPPGSPFPRGYSKGDDKIFLKNDECNDNQNEKMKTNYFDLAQSVAASFS